jgi:hypothetical protein
MITNHTPVSRWRRISTTATVVLAAGAVGAGALGFAITATAEPTSTDTAPYNACLKFHKANGATTTEARFDCCVIVGWNWVGGTYPAGYCVSPAFDTRPAPTPPSPGATVILPPGSNARLGDL